ncbi:MAG: PKD domain-containing protein [Thermoplasmata archaeon]
MSKIGRVGMLSAIIVVSLVMVSYIPPSVSGETTLWFQTPWDCTFHNADVPPSINGAAYATHKDILIDASIGRIYIYNNFVSIGGGAIYLLRYGGFRHPANQFTVSTTGYYDVSFKFMVKGTAENAIFQTGIIPAAGRSYVKITLKSQIMMMAGGTASYIVNSGENILYSHDIGFIGFTFGSWNNEYKTIQFSAYLRSDSSYYFKAWMEVETLSSALGGVSTTSIADITAYLQSVTITLPTSYPPPPGGCPYISTFDGNDFNLDNNLLPQSETPFREDVDVTDYYLLQTQPLLSNNTYQLKLSEMENAHSLIDKFQVYAVDHHSNIKIGLTTNGEIRSYIAPEPPLSAMDNYGVNQTAKVIAEDNLWFEGNHREALVLEFNNPNLGTQRLVIKHSTMGSTYIPQSVYPPVKESILVQYLSEENTWWNLTIIPTRNLWSTTIVDLPQNASHEKLFVKLYFLNLHKIDFVGLDSSVNADISVTELPLLSAMSSLHGNITEKIMQRDYRYAEVSGDGDILLSYKSVGLPTIPETTRDFLVLSVGYYYPSEGYRELGEIEVEEKVKIKVEMEGRKGNTIGVVLYSSGEGNNSKIQNITFVERTPGKPNIVEMNVYYRPGNLFGLSLYYNGSNGGANPVKVRVVGSKGEEQYNLLFNSAEGENQVFSLNIHTAIRNVTSIQIINETIIIAENTVLRFSFSANYSSPLLGWSSVTWNFGDDSTSPEETATHEFSVQGFYIVRLLPAYIDGMMLHKIAFVKVG